MKKILIIMGGFFPGKKYGGPPISIKNFCELVDEECYIVTTNHDLGEKTPYDNIVSGQWICKEKYKIMYLPEKQFVKKVFEGIFKEVKPDILYLQGIFQRCIFPCLCIAKKQKVKVFLAPRGELCKGAFVHKNFKKKIYIYILRMMGVIKNIVYQSTSEDETESIHNMLGVDYTHICYLTNIPTIIHATNASHCKEKGKANIVFLSRIQPKKNLYFALECIKDVKGYINFDIYGPIEDHEYWEKCCDFIQTFDDNKNVRYCGILRHDEVAQKLSEYDAFILPTYSENYGHAIVEAFLSGLPVVISDNTPWKNLQQFSAGWDLSIDSKEAYVNALQEIINWNSIDFIEISQHVIAYINKQIDLKQIKREYESVLENI